MKQILFLSPYSFRRVNGGSVLFGELFKAFKKNTISWFICAESFENTLLKYQFKTIEYFKSPFFEFQFFNIIARKFVILGFPFFFFKYKLVSIFCSWKVIRLMKKEKINFLWIYVSQSAIPVGKLVHKKIKIPLHLSIQDDIYTHLALYESKFLEKDFKYLIENANTIDFISKEMGQYYKEKFSIKAKTITFMVSRYIEVPKPNLSQDIKKIGYAGNIWCKENFRILLEALEELDNNYSKLIKVYAYTNDSPRTYFSKFGKYIVFLPVVEYEKLIYELQKCDLLYLPMTFMPQRMITNITSFPSKLLTYMNTKIPILNHSPKGAVSHNFIIENEIGYSIFSEDKKTIIDFFLNTEENLSLEQRNLYSENENIILEKFDTKRMTDSFISLIEN